MQTPRKPWWQQATALVSLGTGGAITGFAFAHGTPEHLASPASVPVTLTALDQATEPGTAQAATDDTVARSAIVKVASYYAKLAQSKTPAEMEALIWQQDSADGADHGQSCAAFASMTLQLGAQLAGKQSWVTGGSTYPWPLHDWVDARVDPNSDSMNVTSILQDAEAAGRYHPVGNGYLPQPGDWVLFDQHVEVVTGYSGGVLSTIGGDSLPNLSVNSHEYSGSLAADGVQGFVDNGNLPAATTAATSSGSAAKSSSSSSSPAAKSPAAKQQSAAGTQATSQAATQVTEAMAAIPGVPADLGSASSSAPAASSTGTGDGTASTGRGSASTGTGSSSSQARTTGQPQAEPSAAIPGVPDTTGATHRSSSSSSSSSSARSSSSSSSYQRHQSSSSPSATTPGTAAQRAFIDSIAPGAVAAQRTYGVPAAVTIAQAIDESAWGQSTLASEDHNLFGIKGTGPAGSVPMPTQEVYDGQAVSTTADFRVYNDVSESIEDHGKLLADGASYTAAMANKQSPNAFATALTGVYATDPNYGTSLIGLMRQYNLYRYDAAATSGSSAPSASGAPATKTSPKSHPHGATQSHPASRAKTSTQPTAKAASPSLAPPTTAPSARPTSPVTSPSPSASSATAPTPTASSPASPTASTPAAPAAPSASSSSSASSGWPAGATPSSSAAGSSTGSGPGASNDTGSGSGSRGVASGDAQIPGIPEPAGTAAGSSDSSSGSGQGSSPAAQASTSAVVSSSTTVTDAELTAVYRPAAERTASAEAAAPVKDTAPHKAAARKAPKRKGATAKARKAAPRYQPEMPTAVKSALLSSARKPLARAEFLYRDVAASVGLSWKILAACDWMQCDAHPRYSPVRGEKLGSVNPDGTVFHTKSEALTQSARDLVALADAVYEIDLTLPVALSVLELANVFAAYRWGGLLRQHRTSAMEFPYSIQGLTDQFLHMRWPKIPDPNAPDKPGSRFKRSFGAVPVVLSLDYPAIVL